MDLKNIFNSKVTIIIIIALVISIFLIMKLNLINNKVKKTDEQTLQQQKVAIHKIDSLISVHEKYSGWNIINSQNTLESIKKYKNSVGNDSAYIAHLDRFYTVDNQLLETSIDSLIKSVDFDKKEADGLLKFIENNPKNYKIDTARLSQLKDYRTICDVVKKSKRSIKGEIWDDKYNNKDTVKKSRGQIARDLIYLTNWEESVSKCKKNFKPSIKTELKLTPEQKALLVLHTRIAIYMWSNKNDIKNGQEFIEVYNGNHYSKLATELVDLIRLVAPKANE